MIDGPKDNDRPHTPHDRRTPMTPDHLVKLSGNGCPDSTCPATYGVPGGYWIQGTRLGPAPDGQLVIELPVSFIDDIGHPGPAAQPTDHGTYLVTGQWVGEDGHKMLTNCAPHETAVHVTAEQLIDTTIGAVA